MITVYAKDRMKGKDKIKKPLPKKKALFIVLFRLRLSLSEQKISSSTGMKIRSSAVPDSSLH
jgi:hypothetical protein